MSDTMVSLRRKIDSAADLHAVVRTMKALAASSIGQYEKSVRALHQYSRIVELGLGACLRQGEVAGSVSERRGDVDPSETVAVVFGSDQGLVGEFNEVVANDALAALTALPERPQVWAVGERVHARLTDLGLPPMGIFGVPTSVQAITPLIGQILVQFEGGLGPSGIGDLHLFYNRSTSGAVYAPVRQRLLPLDDEWRRTRVELAWPTRNLTEVMGSGTATLEALIREYVFISLFRACAESLASENASRLSAMERAERNIDDLLEQLRGSFHRLRQSSTDEELFDVIAGFEALASPQAPAERQARFPRSGG